MADETTQDGGGPERFTLEVPGRLVPGLAATRGAAAGAAAAGDDAGLGEFAAEVRTSLLQAVAVETTRAGAAPTTVEADADDLVELELDGGVRQWLTVERLAELADRPASRGGIGGARTGAGGRVIELSPVLRLGTPSRGGGELALRALRVFGVDVAAGAARVVARRLEDRLRPSAGLYRFSTQGADGGPPGSGATLVEGAPLAAGDLRGSGPFLVFLHGTASTTEGSFSGLTGAGDGQGTDEWQRLAGAYGDRLLALQHRTLSESPIENTLDLLAVLPENAELHLVSHSRGGLIGELLCRAARSDGLAPFTAEDLAANLARARPAAGGDRDALAEREAEHERLERLSAELARKRPRVERFVRAACPARGTVLASRRLDRSLTLLLNAIGLVPALVTSPTYRFAKALLLALAKKRADPRELPGLEAMMPESPLVALLNTSPALAAADLRVIAGDLEGVGLAGRLKTFATDLFFRQDHDLVVDTSAMFGGVRRVAGRAYYFFDRGSDVSHFRYFANPHSRRRVADGLLAPAAPPGFQPLPSQSGAVPAASVRGAGSRVSSAGMTADRPVVVVLPGIMGSHLASGDDTVWLDWDDLAAGGLTRLEVDSPNVEAKALIDASYARLIDYLAGTHQVYPFPFDWRLSLDRAANRLAAEVRQILDRVGPQPVRFLAHSMGGLVVRRLRSQHPALWAELAGRHGFRFVMLGTPTAGSWTIPAILLGQERVLRMLALLDSRHGSEGWVRRVRRFPGLLEMMPAGDPTLFEEATWQGWAGLEGLTAPQAQDLSAARELRSALDGPPLTAADAICYVAGRAPLTPKGLKVAERRGRKRAVLVGSPAGDGRVLWETIPTGVPAWYCDVAHGALSSERRLFPAFLDLLVRGTTTLLSSSEPTGLRGAVEVELPLAEEDPVLFPDLPDLQAAALGFERAPEKAPEGPPLRVVVVHGSAAFSRHAVVVGHYEGDVIASVEAVLDRQVLGGALTRCHQLGLYPGPVGTARAFLVPGEPTRGAVITGLGEVGGISPGTVQTAMRHATLAYALEVAACSTWPGDAAGLRKDEAGDPRPISLSVVLVGTGQGSGLGVDDSVRALIHGVAEAERTLRSVRPRQEVQVVELEILELYDDRALCAADALRRLAAVADDVAGVRLDPVLELELGTGAQARTACPSDGGWWRRLQISHDEKGELTFLSLTDRARAERTLQSTQEKLVDGFVSRSVTSPVWQREQAATLFELLVPRELKDYAPDQRDLLLVLDEAAARFPWELLVDGLGGGDPLAVRAGMLRQLTTSTYRRDVVTPFGNDALVVGDPPTRDPRFPPLPGARAEAQAVADELADRDWNVDKQIGTEPEQVVQALFTRGYRLIHIAAHGVHRRDLDRLSGVVLGDQILLSPRELSQMRRVPEMVFVNCCHLGTMGDGGAAAGATTAGRNELAASFGVELIGMGVRAAVVAGWAVDDAAADTFARSFYRRMLDGDSFGTAVHEARRETYRRHPAVNTWGAYQCYGDPEYRFVVGEGGGAQQLAPWVTPRSPVGELENLQREAQVGSTDLRPRIEAIEACLEQKHPAWLKRADLRVALGSAWGEVAEAAYVATATAEDRRRALECFERAIAHLDHGLATGETVLMIDTAVLRSSLELRRLLVLWRGDAAGRPPLRTLQRDLRRLIRGLDATVRAAPTHYGRTVLAVAHRKLAAMETDPQKRLQALGKAVAQYRSTFQAVAEAPGHSPEDRRNALVDLVVASALARLLGEPFDEARRNEVSAWVHEVQRRPEGLAPTFWGRELEGEAKLARLLWERAIEAPQSETPEEVALAYRPALRGARSGRQGTLALEVLESLIESLAGSGGGDPDSPQARALADLYEVREQLRKMVEGRSG